MTPFQRAAYPEKQGRKLRDEMAKHFIEHPEEVKHLTNGEPMTVGLAYKMANVGIQEAQRGEVWMNDQWQVHILDLDMPEGWPAMKHLSIKRLDRSVIRDWRELQTIKNMLMGEECEAVELYPAESRLVDSANQYHLFCLVDPKQRWPFGFTERFVSNAEVGGSKQRALEGGAAHGK